LPSIAVPLLFSDLVSRAIPLTDLNDHAVEFRMDMIRLADLDYQSVSSSPLDDRLLQLSSDSREFSDSDETRVTTYTPSEPQHSEASPEFLAWTDRFEGNRDQITRRLSLIEAELDRLEKPGASLSLGVYEVH